MTTCSVWPASIKLVIQETRCSGQSGFNLIHTHLTSRFSAVFQTLNLEVWSLHIRQKHCGLISRFHQSLRDSQKWNHRRMLWTGQNNHDSPREICIVAEYFQPCFSFFLLLFVFFQIGVASIPPSLSLPPPYFSPLFFPIINWRLIFQPSTEERTLTEEESSHVWFQLESGMWLQEV